MLLSISFSKNQCKNSEKFKVPLKSNEKDLQGFSTWKD